ncbi:MAG TPA: hypothetical protein VKW04_01595 [Planctomycetota bacterium]|nr:hypothetical protein [Planctomycetota bacterium]
MKALLSALLGVYTRWRYVEDTDSSDQPAPNARPESTKDELLRLKASVARERRNLESYLRFNCPALAGPCEGSIRAMEGRIRALEMFTRRAV